MREIKNFVDRERFGMLNTVSFFALCLLVIDCAISGGGKWLTIGWFSLRIILGLISLICAIPSILKSVRNWVKNPIFISMALFVVLIIINAAIGYSRGNRTDLILSDIKGFVWLFLVPVSLAVVNNKKRLHFIMKCLIVGAVVQAFLILGLHITMLYIKGINFNSAIEPIQLGFIVNINNSLFRIFSRSGPYMVAASVLMTYFQMKEKKFRWWLAAGIGVCINGVLLSYTRSLYGAALVAVLLTLIFVFVFIRCQWKRILLHLGTIVVMFVVLLFAQQALSNANYIQFAINRTVPTTQADKDVDKEEKTQKEIMKHDYINRVTKKSDDVRVITITQLNDSIAKSPVIGNGLGAAIEYRQDGLVEYFYHDLVNKMGFIGLFVYCFPLFYMVFIVMLRKKRLGENGFLGATWIATVSAFFTMTIFNPYMNASLGITVYALAMSCFTLIRNEGGTAEE